jgi:hypothetical protein
MPPASQYQAQATAIYAPQESAEESTLNATQATNEAGFTSDTNAANLAYNQSLDSQTKTEATGEDKNNFNSAVHGFALSGLAANANRLTYQNYQDNVSKLGTSRAEKLSDIAGKQQAEETGYNDQLGALQSKYQGEEADYVATHVNDDQKQAATEAAANARAAASAANRAPTAQQNQQGYNATLTSLFQGYSPGNKSMQGYTEKVVIPSLMQAGLSATAAKSQAYAYRMSEFGQ